MNLPSRNSRSHKGENGKVAVIAGSRDYTGAPALASKAALRTGSDLVKTLTSKDIQDTVASYSPNFIVRSYPGCYLSPNGVKPALELVRWADVTLIGPGLSKPDTEALKQIFQNAQTKWVIDADGIMPAIEVEVSNAIFTPHSGEVNYITDAYGSIESFVEQTGNVVVEKGSTDKIYSKNGVKENNTGTSAMTVGGTGDVLAGIITSLISQGMELQNAAYTGAVINGKAGELAAENYGNGMLATDLIENIPGAMKNI
ncbi:NAD(P)H-hydrate dehydratase [Candidatus Nanohalococcus occultus]|uniref:NAD(P)H-hydrate dehydratase n=1 Tax=Candidatus Nanohalococcus occultus TaxID=2978047 RepID=UPI0039E1C422